MLKREAILKVLWGLLRREERTYPETGATAGNGGKLLERF